MNVVLSLMQRDQCTAEKVRFGLSTFVLLFTQAVTRIYPHAHHLSQIFRA